jgi:hypothetical protein
MKPGEQEGGEEEEEGHLHRLELVVGDGGEGDSEGEIGPDEQEHDREQERQAAFERDIERSPCGEEDDAGLEVADQDVGDDLAEHDLRGARRGGEQVFHGAPFALRVMATAVMMTMVMVSTTPSRPGTMLYWVMPSGL